MNRHQGSKGKGKPSGRGGDTSKGKSYARGNAPIKKGGATPTPKPKKPSNPNEIRLNKYIANSGMCSRREADEHIAIGLVTVNGKVINEMGYKVKLEDEVRYDGARINPEQKAYVLLNKPKGFATTTSEGKGRTVMDLVANATSSRIKPIGRLGRNSKGLLFFTNDDIIADKFTNSKKGVARLFHLELNKNLRLEDLKKIQEGVVVDEKVVREVVNLDCVAIGHLTKKDIPRGSWKHLTEQELNTLKML